MLQEFPGQLVAAEHHLWDLWASEWTARRADEYNVPGVPDVYIDGVIHELGAYDCQAAADRYRDLILQRLAETGGTSPVRIDGYVARSGSTITLSATFGLVDPVALGDGRACLLVLENGLSYQDSTYDHVTRAARECRFRLDQPGDVALFAAEFTVYADWNAGNLECLALLQAPDGDHEVYQAARLPEASDFACGFEFTSASSPSGSETLEFEGTVRNLRSAPDALTFTLDDTWGWPAVFRVEGDPGFHHDPVTRFLAPGQELDVLVRVTTDGDRRIGTGCLAVRSAATDRTQRIPLTVFNASPSVLVVDADGAHGDEAVVLDALTRGGYLYRHWDVYFGADGRSPAFADLRGYDVVVWHHGWQFYNLEPAEATALLEYVAGGGGLILSSQDALGGLTPGTFTRDYLGLEDWDANVGASRAVGVPGDPVGDGIDAALTYTYPYLNHADDLIPNAFGTVALTSEAAARIAVRADNGSTRTVVLAFCLNAMDPDQPDPSNPKTLLARSIEWLLEASGQGVRPEPPQLAVSGVTAISPNPAIPAPGGPGLRIRLRISAAAAGNRVTLDVFDVNGRRVRGLFEGCPFAGPHALAWDGRDADGRSVAAGVYQLRLTTAEGRCDARAVLLR